MNKFSVLMFSTILSAGCGGGGDSAPVDTGPTRLYGKIVTVTGAPVSGAKITIPYATDLGYEATTSADGSFILEADPAEFVDVSPVAVTVQAPNYQPDAIYLSSLRRPANERIDLPEKGLRGLGPAEFVLSSDARPLIHLGDDAYRGTTNSKLQVATSGLATVQPIGTWTQANKDQYRSAVIEFSARGLQTNGSMQCATRYDNQIGLLATVESPAGSITRTVQPGSSSEQGSFTRMSIPIDVSDFAVGSQVNFVASSGRCISGGTDHDDYEFTAVVVRFLP